MILYTNLGVIDPPQIAHFRETSAAGALFAFEATYGFLVQFWLVILVGQCPLCLPAVCWRINRRAAHMSWDLNFHHDGYECATTHAHLVGRRLGNGRVHSTRGPAQSELRILLGLRLRAAICLGVRHLVRALGIGSDRQQVTT